MSEPTSLYRFISFPEFVNIVETKTVRFVDPCTWEDTYEGYMLRLLENSSRRKEVITALSKYVCDSPNSILDNFFKLLTAKRCSVGQCWTREAESDAMWRIYSYDKMSVRIETDTERIKKLIDESQFGCRIDNIKYDLDINLSAESQAMLLQKQRFVNEPFYHKRKAFKHEKETRVILTISEYQKALLYFTLNQARKELVKMKKKGQEITVDELVDVINGNMVFKSQKDECKVEHKKDVMLDIPDVSQYIKSVMVHPLAPEWIVKLTETICNRNGIKYIGKSNLYGKL